MKGDKVILVNSDKDVAAWGGNKIPSEHGLVIGCTYIVEAEEVHTWHTKLWIGGHIGPFNSAHFEEVE